MIITLDQLHNLIASAYAVCVNDTLYFVGYDASTDASTDAPYTATNDGDDYISYEKVDGDIEISENDSNAIFFTIDNKPIRMILLTIMEPKV